MRKNFCILSIYVLLTSCNSTAGKPRSELEEATAELISNSYLQNHSLPNFKTIHLNNFENFGALLEKMQSLSCKEKSIGIEFRDNDTIYKLTGWAECPSSGVISDYFNRNRMIIKNDSLKNLSGDWDKIVHFSNLERELVKISSEDYHYQYNKENLKPALIHFHVEDTFSISKTREVLKEITKQFKKMNSKMGTDFFQYDILFEEFSLIDLSNPPPPPPPGIK